MKRLPAFLLFFVILLGLVYLYLAEWRPSGILPREVAMAEYRLPESKFLDWNGSRIHYTDAGTGQPVLMIHGLGGSCYDFARTDSLLRKDYRVIRVDLPGFGLSDFPGAAGANTDFTAVYSRFFDFFLDTLQLDSLYVLGNSMGGLVSWYMAATHPEKVRKLVLFNSAGYDLERISRHVTSVLRYSAVQRILQRGIPESFTRMGLRKVLYDKSLYTSSKVHRVNTFWNTEGHMQVIFGLAQSGQYPDTALIQQIQCPTLVVWGKQDQLIPVEHAERFDRDIRNSRVIVYDSCGHVPMIERPQDVFRDLRQFFAE